MGHGKVSGHGASVCRRANDSSPWPQTPQIPKPETGERSGVEPELVRVFYFKVSHKVLKELDKAPLPPSVLVEARKSSLQSL